jgi:hypothetical protein
MFGTSAAIDVITRMVPEESGNYFSCTIALFKRHTSTSWCDSHNSKLGASES